MYACVHVCFYLDLAHFVLRNRLFLFTSALYKRGPRCRVVSPLKAAGSQMLLTPYLHIDTLRHELTHHCMLKQTSQFRSLAPSLALVHKIYKICHPVPPSVY